MNFVFTGTFKLEEGEHVTRNLLTEIAMETGNGVFSVVSYGIDFVVCGDTGRHGETRKLKAAERMGIPVITPRAFMNMLSA